MPPVPLPQDLFGDGGAAVYAAAAAVGLNSADESLPYSTSELNAPEYSTDDFRMFQFKVGGRSRPTVHAMRRSGHPTALGQFPASGCAPGPPARPPRPSSRPPCLHNPQVARCSKRYVHDWRACPFAHPTENARRRDPRLVKYQPIPCPDYKRGICLRCACGTAVSALRWRQPAAKWGSCLGRWSAAAA